MTPISTRAQIACQGKNGYSATQANRIATDMRRRGRKKVDAYHCQFCGDWHVGSRITTLPDKRRDAREHLKNRDEE